MGEAGFIAFFALVAWVPLCMGIFYTQPPTRAAIICLFGGMLFLPELAELDLPGLPPLEKRSITMLAIFAGYILRTPKRGRFFLGLRGAGLFIPLLLFSAVMTALTNGDPQWHGPAVYLQGLTMSEAISYAVRDGLRIALPFLLGRALFQRRQDLQDLLTGFAVFGLIYSVFCLIEVRMSPQFHRWIYGYGQHDFWQTIRWGGYRPMVFMEHGLAVGLFISQAFLACVALYKARLPVLRFQVKPAVPYLGIMLFFMKSLGALIFGLLGALAMFTSRGRTQLRIASVTAALVLAYPAAQALDILPKDTLVESVAAYAPERAESLGFRLRNETELVAKAMERPLFGWGGYGRQHLWDEENAKNISVTDGYWIIIIGERGGVALAAVLLLLTMGLLVLPRRTRTLQNDTTRAMLGGIALIQTFAVADLIPNGLFTDLPFMLGGALLSLSRGLPLEEHTEGFAAAAAPRPAPPAPPNPYDPSWMPNPAPSRLPGDLDGDGGG